MGPGSASFRVPCPILSGLYARRGSRPTADPFQALAPREPGVTAGCLAHRDMTASSLGFVTR
jgi:hypothetical protein